MAHDHLDIDTRNRPAACWLVENWHVAPQSVTRTVRRVFGRKLGGAVKAIEQAGIVNKRASGC